MPTLKDIAKRCDTSITTVSRVLNFDKTLSVTDVLKRQIFEVAAELNYQSPRQKKVAKKTHHIGIIHWYDNVQEIDDPYYLDIRKGIEQYSSKQEIKTTLLYKQGDRFQLDLLKGVDGLICIGKFSKKQIDNFTRITENIVFVDSSPDVDRFDSVVIDFRKAVNDIVDEILKSGKKNIGYIGGAEEVDHEQYLGERRESEFRGLLEVNQLYQPCYFHVGSFTLDSGYTIMKDIIRSGIIADVYFCANDAIAIGALRACHEEGIKIPKDVSLIGFNDSSMSAYMTPPLTTVKVFTMLLGEEAVESVMQRINRRMIPIRKIIPTKFIYRGSFLKGDLR